MFDPLDLAWLTGLFEGEGCISARPGRGWTLAVSMTDRDVVERVHRIAQVGRVYYVRPRSRPNGVVWAEQWRWTVERRDDVHALLTAMYPLLGQRRRAKADEFVEWYNSTGPGKPRTSRLTPDGASMCGQCGGIRRRKGNGSLYCPACQASYKRRHLAKG